LLRAFQWASDRLRVSPLRRELLILVAGGLFGFAVLLAVPLALDRSVGPLLGVALGTIVGMCGWTLYLHRRVDKVARVNRAS
jgi:uncharacterized membrane protein YccC